MRGYAFALGLLAVLVLAGCPDSNTSGPANEAGVVKVGVVLPMTGGTATYGEETWNGLQMALEDVRTQGRMRIEIAGGRPRDTQGNPQRTFEMVEQLITVDRVSVVLGSVESSSSIQGARSAQDHGIPMMTPASTNVTVTQAGEFISRICFIDPFQGAVAARFAYEDLGKRRAALVVDQGQDYCRGLADAFDETFRRLGGTIATRETYTSESSADFSTIIARVRDANPDCIFIPGYHPQVGPMLRQADQAWGSIPRLGGDGWDSADLFSLAGPGLHDCYMVSHFSPEDTDPTVSGFVARYRARYNQAPGSMAALGYDAGLALKDAAERAGSADPVALRDAINTIAGLRGVTGTITLNAERNAVKDAVVLRVSPDGTHFARRVPAGS